MIEEGVVRQLKAMQPGRPLPLQPWHHMRAGMDTTSMAEACTWVSTPRASTLTRSLLDGIIFHPETPVIDVIEEAGWWLKTERGGLWGPYTRVVIAVPAPQAVSLLSVCPELQQRAHEVVMSPAWVLLADLEQRPRNLADIDLLQGEHLVLARACRDSSKPERRGEVWQLEAATEWSSRHVNADVDWVAAQMLEAFAALAGEMPEIRHQRVQRWRYAHVAWSPGTMSVSNCGQIAVCGDWVCGPGVAGAVQSAEQLIRALEAAG